MASAPHARVPTASHQSWRSARWSARTTIAGRRARAAPSRGPNTCWRSSGVRKEFPGVVALDDVSFKPEARHRARADGRERRRQVDADEDHRRHLPSRRRRDPPARQADAARIAARCARERHRHDPSGTQPDAVHDGRREHLDPARAARTASASSIMARCAARRRRCSTRCKIDIDPEVEVRAPDASPTGRWSRSPRPSPTNPTS